jgi:hypothetical protein
MELYRINILYIRIYIVILPAFTAKSISKFFLSLYFVNNYSLLIFINSQMVFFFNIINLCYYEIQNNVLFSMTGQEKGDLLIQVTA